jgi:GNAT superfamily N-acetyltransferase
MGKEIEVRLYQSGEEKDIVELLSLAYETYRKLENPLDYWKWKFQDTPLGSIIRVAKLDDKIVGVGHGLLFNIKIGEEILLGHNSVDVATHPDYRGMGVFSRINELNQKVREEKGAKFVYSISSNPIIINRRNLSAEHAVFPRVISYMIRIRDVDKHLKNRPVTNTYLKKRLTTNPSLIGLGYRSLETINKLRKIVKKDEGSQNDFNIEEVKKFDPRIDAFWGRVKDGCSFILEKDQRFLNWRYCDPRGGEFQIFQAIQGGDVLGFIILQTICDDGYAECFIMDMLTLSERYDVATALMQQACASLDDKGVNVMYYEVVKGHSYQNISQSCDFINTRSGPLLRCKFPGRTYNVVNESIPDKIHFNYGDSL